MQHFKPLPRHLTNENESFHKKNCHKIPVCPFQTFRGQDLIKKQPQNDNLQERYFR